ncbi:MAG: M48 family metallopeptidase [Alphaproteobacteria bacterium]|nr:M48 family metallopeptidase [Alphaproteobacteria bacterium]MBR1649464.1 M48 family metallopeptidase [Alphaproteobacteria bacterium]
MKITLLTGKTFDIARKSGIDLEVINSPKARRLSIKIDTKKQKPVLIVPKFCSSQRALAFVKKNQAWIEERMRMLVPRKDFEDGEKITLAGQEVVITHCPERHLGAELNEGRLNVSGDKIFLSRRVKDFIKEYAQHFLYELSIKKAQKIACKLNRVVIKDTKTRWGSCSSLNNINYSWRIMLAPMEVIDYLVAHEVAHLKYPNHQKEFWDCVADLCPDVGKGRAWLKQNGEKLNRYA